MSDFRNMRNEVLECYESNHSVADDDKMLIAMIWNRHGWDNSENLYENLKKMPSAETIRRTRQKLVADGLIKQSEKSVEKRYKAFKKYREEFAREQWECL